jgi:hypothetical protein
MGRFPYADPRQIGASAVATKITYTTGAGGYSRRSAIVAPWPDGCHGWQSEVNDDWGVRWSSL